MTDRKQVVCRVVDHNYSLPSKSEVSLSSDFKYYVLFGTSLVSDYIKSINWLTIENITFYSYTPVNWYCKILKGDLSIVSEPEVEHFKA